MITLPLDAKKIDLAGSTVDFFTFENDAITYIYFDTSLTAAPEPMINAMRGLSLINDTKHKLIMINHQKPMGLLGKIGQNFDAEVSSLDNGDFQLIFSYKEGVSEEADLADSHCSG